MIAFVIATGLGSLLGSGSRNSLIAVSIALVLSGAAALWWRRSHPVAVLAVVVLAVVPEFVIARDHEPAGAALAFAVYAVSVYDRGRVRLWVAGTAIAVIGVAVALLLLGDFQTARSLIPSGAISLVAWVIGDYMRSRRQFFLDLVTRHQQAREQAAEEERLRIARELHDVVAHNVSAMAIQAGAARVTGSPSADALKSIEITARDTLSELNRLLGVLRKDPGAPDLSPQPGPDQVDGLLRPARDAGIEATLKVIGEKRALPAALDLSAYRIVQEAVTNVLKHAQASRVEVTIDYKADSLVLTISDNGSGSNAAAGASTGHGLIGMRERVELFNGELGATSSSLGGFTVRAKLPVGG